MTAAPDLAEIIVLDPYLRSIGSHHLQYDLSLFQAARRLGLGVRFFCHRDATPAVLSALPATPAFASLPGWPGRWFAGPGRWLPPQVAGLTHLWLEYRQRRREFAACLCAPGPPERLVLIPDGGTAISLALRRVLRRARVADGARAVLVFHHPAGGPLNRLLARRSLRALRPLIRRGQVRLTATNEPLAESYRALSGLPFEVLPWPLEFPPPVAGTSAGGPPGPVHFLAIGGFRIEKGVDLLARSLQDLTPEIDGGRLRFTIQGYPNPQVPDPVANRYFEELRAFAATHPGVRIIDRALDPQGADYGQLYAEADVLLLPYRQPAYAMRISAVLMEALALGKPVVVTEDTCMARQIDGWAGLTFPDRDASALTQAIRRIAADLPRHVEAVRRGQPAWKAFHHPDHYLRMVTAPAPALAPPGADALRSAR